MRSWILRGLRKGVVTTSFPVKEAEDAPPWSTRPVRRKEGEVICPVNAVKGDDVDMCRCISCGRCSPQFEPDLTVSTAVVNRVAPEFSRSFHIYVIDTGSCGACNTEVHALSNPVYDFNRLGIFFTNTPRHADALLIVGVLAKGMEDVLLEAYDAMPAPKIVIASGACAISGGVMGNQVTQRIYADILVPGCPPGPFTILDAILRARRKQ